MPEVRSRSSIQISSKPIHIIHLWIFTFLKIVFIIFNIIIIIVVVRMTIIAITIIVILVIVVSKLG